MTWWRHLDVESIVVTNLRIMLQGGDTWVLNHPYESPEFILADVGYDIRIGNSITKCYNYGHGYLTQENEV